MEQVIIHAGHGKTGSSAIQKFLNDNRKLLWQEGIWYPEHTVEKSGISSGNHEVLLSRDATGAYQVSPSKVQKLLRQLETASANILVLSSEVFFIHLKDLAAAIPKASFIVYLRDPLSYAESGYNQAVKRGQEKLPFTLDEKPSFGIIHHLDELLNTVIADKINLRYYHRDCFAGGSLISDFLEATGLKLEAIDLQEKVNPSYSFEALELKRFLNFFPLPQATSYLLDKSLQVYRGGAGSYSLIAPSDYEQFKMINLQGLRDFFQKHPFPGSAEYLKKLEKTEQKSYHSQPARENDLKDVVQYLRKDKPMLYQQLRDVVGKNTADEKLSGFRKFFLAQPGFSRSAAKLFRARFAVYRRLRGWKSKSSLL